MKNKEKKVIILDNIASPFISQAIIILKEGAEYEENNIIKEAEKIVSGYFSKIKKIPQKEHKALMGNYNFNINIGCFSYFITLKPLQLLLLSHHNFHS